jgi:enterochelin esterase-like enzyme
MPKIKTLIQRVQEEGTPLINGNQATFVWLGETAPLLIGDMNMWTRDNHPPIMLEKAGKNVWTHTLTLPRDAYIEYIYTYDWSDKDTVLLDPHNKRPVGDGFNSFNASFAMPDFRYNPYLRHKKGIKRGTVSKHSIQNPFFVLGNKRDVWLYQPPSDAPVPLLLAYDGWDYLYRAKLPHMLDNLIAQKMIPPIAVAFVQNAKQGRIVEYGMSDMFLKVILDDILPLAHKHLNLLDPSQHAGAFAVTGASMGGLMALYTGLRLSHIFGRVISLSGAFQFDHAPQVPLLIKQLVQLPKVDLRIWQSVESFEWLLNTNRQVRAFLQEAGYNPVYHEYNGAHNWTSWQTRLPQALQAIFGNGV